MILGSGHERFSSCWRRVAGGRMRPGLAGLVEREGEPMSSRCTCTSSRWGGAIAGSLVVAVLGVRPSVTHGQGIFLRGNSNGDEQVDLSDAVSTLSFLFSGGPAASCPDAADANDDGKVDISDPVYTLDFLFLGGPAPSAPGNTTPGMDSTPDDMSCGEPGTAVVGEEGVSHLLSNTACPASGCGSRSGEEK